MHRLNSWQEVQVKNSAGVEAEYACPRALGVILKRHISPAESGWQRIPWRASLLLLQRNAISAGTVVPAPAARSDYEKHGQQPAGQHNSPITGMRSEDLGRISAKKTESGFI